MRLCVDYRQLNAITLRPIYPIPEATQIFDFLEGAKVLSVSDLSHGYYNVEKEETDRLNTAFATVAVNMNLIECLSDLAPHLQLFKS